MTCECGFKFSGPGQFRNCAALVTQDGKSGVICPKCGRSYIDGELVVIMGVTQTNPKNP